MTEVVRSNLSKIYPHIEDCISRCDFVGIDTEFTGLYAQPEDQRSFFDSLEECYQKLRRFAQTYFICQFGLSVFIKENDPDTNRYLVHTFNFHTFPRSGTHFKVGFQTSNAEFLCQYNFDFNKLFYEGIPYLNQKQEEQLLASQNDGHPVNEDELGFTRIFRLLQSAQKPVIGHNMLSDLMLMYSMFHNPLPDSYCEFKSELHRIFPLVIDTKSLCYGVRKQLMKTNLMEFSSLVDLYEALGSKRGTYHVLCAPSVIHSDPKVNEKYTARKMFHEAGFDAFCAGLIFLRIAHLLAMDGVESSNARPVHIRQYFRVVEPYSNQVNLIRGPIHYINLGGVDPPGCRSDWLVVRSKNGEQMSPKMIQYCLDCDVLDVRNTSPTSAVVVLSSRKRAEQLLQEDNEFVIIRRYRWIVDSSTGSFILWKLVIPGIGMGLIGIGIGLFSKMYVTDKTFS